MSLIFTSLEAAPRWAPRPAEIPTTRRSPATATSAYRSRVPLTKQLYPQNHPAALLFSEPHQQQRDRSSAVGSTLRALGARPCPLPPGGAAAGVGLQRRYGLTAPAEAKRSCLRPLTLGDDLTPWGIFSYASFSV